MRTDKWKQLRADMGLFGNTEPEVNLISMTVPGYLSSDENEEPYFRCEGINYHPTHIEPQIAQAATVSTGILAKNHQNTIMSLIKQRHDTPFECIQFNFKVSGISKICGSQLSRHRVGQGHVSSSRRYQRQREQFVYPLFEQIDDKRDAEQAYLVTQDAYRESIQYHNRLQKFDSLTKSDRRYVVPAATAATRIWWINGRALRDFFRLRLHPTAESEIRRLAYMTLGIAQVVCPTLFYDFDMEDI